MSMTEKEAKIAIGITLNLVFVLAGLAGAYNRLRDRFAVPPPPEVISWQPKTILAKVTAYDPDWRCTGRWSKYKKTATGTDALTTVGVAADFGLLPPGTKLYIPDVGIRTVDDTGGAMRRSAAIGIYHIDVRVLTHKIAKRFGVKWQIVPVLRLGVF